MMIRATKIVSALVVSPYVLTCLDHDFSISKRLRESPPFVRACVFAGCAYPLLLGNDPTESLPLLIELVLLALGYYLLATHNKKSNS